MASGWELSEKAKADLKRGIAEANARIAERERAEAERQRGIARRHAEHLEELKAKREADRQRSELKLDEDMADERARIERQWLADHPDKKPADFKKLAWPHLRENLKEEIRKRDLEATIAAGRRNPDYWF